MNINKNSSDTEKIYKNLKGFNIYIKDNQVNNIFLKKPETDNESNKTSLKKIMSVIKRKIA